MILMYKILIDLIWDVVFSDQGISWIFEMLNKTVLIQSLDIQRRFDEFGTIFSMVRNTIFLYSYYLIILKFIKKIFDVYALQTDGDANADIFVLITNFCKAMVISMSFTTIWSWILDIAFDFSNDLLASLSLVDGKSIYDALRLMGESSGNTPLILLIPVFALLAGILMIFQIKNGVELWLLRIGMPLACCGLLDSDQGVFKPYTKLLVKEVLTIIIQVFLLNVALFMIMKLDISRIVYSSELAVYAIVVIVVAFATPRILSEFLVPKQGGGGRVMQAVYMGSFLLRGVL